MSSQGGNADQPAVAAGDGDGRSIGRSGRSWVVEVLTTLGLTLVIFLVLQNFVAQPFQVVGFSMEHSLEQGDYVLIDKLSPRWRDYARGDVIVLHPPPGIDPENTPFIKRVIGVAGDTVEVRTDGLVYVNGVALTEPYRYANDAGVVGPTVAQGLARWVVAPGELFVLGDHREASEDSRVFGPIPVSSVIGRAILRYWPLTSLSIIVPPTYQGIPVVDRAP
jgi:signal peptidase I